MSLGRIESVAGSVYVDGSQDFTANGRQGAYAFVVQATSTISVLTGSDGSNLLTTLNLSGKTLYAGAYITVDESITISAMTVSSGSVIAYLYNPKTTF